MGNRTNETKLKNIICYIHYLGVHGNCLKECNLPIKNVVRQFRKERFPNANSSLIIKKCDVNNNNLCIIYIYTLDSVILFAC